MKRAIAPASSEPTKARISAGSSRHDLLPSAAGLDDRPCSIYAIHGGRRANEQ
jgi:hypothetical protein